MSVFSATQRSSVVLSRGSGWSLSQGTALRCALLVGCVCAVALAAIAGTPEHYLVDDPGLARLLRGMAIIKALIVVAGIALLLWRFGRPLTPGMAGIYLGGAWVGSGASMLIWQLTLIPLAAVAFHVALLSFLLAAWRDGKLPVRAGAAVSNGQDGASDI
jgi:hypothetical protein